MDWVETSEKESNDQEQYSRTNCILLVHRLEENKDKTTDDLAVNFPKDTTILSSLKKTLIGVIESESQAYERKDLE